MAQQLLQKAREPNIVKALVEAENLATRNVEERLDFPVLTLEYLKNLTIGVYQVKLALSYIQDKQRDEDEELHIEMLRDRNRLPEPGFLRARVFSRFRNAAKHQLWIAYQSTNEDENDQENEDPIQDYYCTCKSGARTVGTCAHIASIIWFMGYARHQPNIRYPSNQIIESIRDSANRRQPRNINERT
ncbi:hypothetical protein RF55_13409 [Lasius niger]|uniref:SWIM-type domain-containing protein n=1 Tax=Lasius niger TaxID=67767 RepID=A0A0J7N3Q8_LASNI|nr:hypothetical protein RF55_13409 [Lasius niger]